MKNLAPAAASFLALLAGASSSLAAEIYVDGQLAANCAGSYDPAKRACGAGAQTAYSSLAGAAAAAQAGDTVWIRGGSYSEVLAPASSGAAGKPITFQAFSGEQALLTQIGAPAIQVIGRSFVTIRDLTVTNVLGWGRLESADHVLIDANHFSSATATGTTGGLKLVKTTLSRVRGNTFDDGNDSVVVQESDKNVIEGNMFTKARHSLLSVRCGNFNVVRNNRFENADQKAAEIYDCEAVSDAPYKLDATKHNVFEGNFFGLTKASAKNYDYNGIQYAGQKGIVRRNVFAGELGGGLGIQVYPDEALFNYDHRIYNNTFHDNRCYGIIASSSNAPNQYYGTQVRNNILYKNQGCAGEPQQTSIGNTTAVTLADNAEVTTPPGFVDEAKADFHLAMGSPMIDKGAFLTKAVGGGSGKTLKIADAGYFQDGFGIEGEVGDVVQLQGDPATARVVAVDYANNTLTLDQPLTWTDGQALSLAYVGAAPDEGAFEFGQMSGGSSSATGAGGANGAGSAGGAGNGGGGASGGATAGCGCRVEGTADEGSFWGAGVIAAALVMAGARRRGRATSRAVA